MTMPPPQVADIESHLAVVPPLAAGDAAWAAMDTVAVARVIVAARAMVELKATVSALQQSALILIDRMINAGAEGQP